MGSIAPKGSSIKTILDQQLELLPLPHVVPDHQKALLDIYYKILLVLNLLRFNNSSTSLFYFIPFHFFIFGTIPIFSATVLFGNKPTC